VRQAACIAAIACALGVAAAAAPATRVPPAAAAALHAVALSQRAGYLDAATAAAARSEIARAARLVRVLPSGRREHVAVALSEIAAVGNRLVQPQAVALVGELKANDDYFAKHYAPVPKTDITDADGVVYRYFAGRCFEFHPLANFSALANLASAGDVEAVQRLATALAARGVHLSGGGIGWQYYFPYGGGTPWLSGMAQAVAAQAFARAAALVSSGAADLSALAAAAYRAIPNRLLTSVAAGPWIELYSFDRAPVLNAQLQTILSLQSYANMTGDAGAGALAARLERSAAATLLRFDTGYWTYYALPRDPSPVDYQQYVVQLLQRLAPQDTRFAAAATRFASYLHQPPAFRLANGPLASLVFWLSKPATVRVTTAAGPTRVVSLDDGWHTLSWAEPRRAGTYPMHVSAVDLAGNSASFDTLPALRVVAARSTASAPASMPPPAVGLAATATWPAGATTPDANAVALLPQTPLVLHVLANPLPADDPGRAALAQYAASLATQLRPRYLVLAPAPTAATVQAYASALAAIRATVGAAAPGSVVAPLLTDPSLQPALGSLPVVAVQAPATQPSAFGVPVVVDGVAPSATRTYACTPAVVGIVATTPVPAAVATSIAHGTVVCPGLAATVTPTVTFPAQLSPPAGARLQLACDRDCLYLATLERADGTPVVARRGAARAGAPIAVSLPRTTLRAGTYRLDVRVVSEVNPGTVSSVLSGPLVVG